jgi:hypothetical protein
LAIAAEKFGCRPSELIDLRDPVLALDFDLAAAARLLRFRPSALAEAQTTTGDSLAEPRTPRIIYW